MSQQEKSQQEEEKKQEKIWAIHKDKGKCEILGDGPSSYKRKTLVARLESGLIERLPEEEFIDLNYQEIKCEKHPKYGAVRKPRSGCSTCLVMYYQAHPEKKPS